MPSFADRLRTAHQSRFVGREAELSLFENVLEADVPPFAVLYIHGPGGVGKTALTTEMKYRCDDADVPVYAIDARNVEPAPRAVEDALQEMGGTGSDALAETRGVLFVDTFEAWTPLYEWIRTELIPRLPASLLVVLSGRTPPPASWRSDLGLEPLLNVLALRNLPRRLGAAYLDRRGVDHAVRDRILTFSHGHPLALSLAADAAMQGDAESFDPIESPDLVGTLVRRFLERVPTTRHRRAVEACSLVRVCTEPLLTALLESVRDDDEPAGVSQDGRGMPLIGAHDLFSWLRSLSFIETSPEGIFPHDIVRSAVTADLRWRDADTFDELQQRARSFYLDALDDATTAPTVRDDGSGTAQGILTDYLFLFRQNPIVRPFFQRLRDEWNAGTPPVRDGADASDREPLRAMVTRHEGEASAECFAYWWDHDAAEVHVFRDGEPEPAGFLMQIDLSAVTDDDREVDPAVEAACRFLENEAPLREGETAAHFRFWMARDAYQDISPVQSLISAYRVRYYLSTPGLAYTFIPVAEADRWELLFAYGDMQRTPEADFTVGDADVATFGHDWRVVPPQAWLDRLAERDLSPMMDEPEASSPRMLVLSRTDFDDAVKEAFKAHARPEAMHGNPLLRSRLIAESTGLDAPADERIEVLRARLDEAAYSLDSDPTTAKYYRAVRATYLNPQPTQERAAEHLNLAFSTYRRYLKRGIQHVADLLWRDEIGDGASPDD